MSVLELNADNWQREILDFETLVLVDFWHEQCFWCIRLEPEFEEAAKEYKDVVKFAKLNVLSSPENQKIALQYGVLGTPTLIFFCDGRPVGTVVGFQTKERLIQSVGEMIEKHQECIKQSTELQK